MSGENIGVIATFVVYLILLLTIGYLGERKHSKSYSDFISAGRSMGGLVTAISSASSSESVWVMLGLSGLGFWIGAGALWAAIGCIVGFVFNALFVIVRLRRSSEQLDSLTVSDYIEARLGDKSGILRILSSLVISLFMLTYVVAQFTGAGQLFSGMEIAGADTPYWLGVVVGGGIIGLYIVVGGYASVCWTDTVQGILMFLVMLGLPILAVVEAGGPVQVLNGLDGLGLLSISHPEKAGWAAIGFVVGQLGISIGYPGMPHMIVRYMTVSDDQAARRAAWISIAWSVVVLLGSAILGMAVRVISPDLAETAKDAEALVIPFVCREFLHPVVTGIVLSAVTAAIMSTADSQLMYAATSLVHDLRGRRAEQSEASARRLIMYTRVVLVLMTLGAMGAALLEIRLIYTFVLFAWGALGAGFTPIILCSLYWRGYTRWGALASLIIGPLTVVVWHYVPALSAIVYELVPAFVLSTLASVVVSLATPGAAKEARRDALGAG